MRERVASIEDRAGTSRRDFVTCLSALSLVGLARPRAAEANEEEDATTSAKAWLEVVDAGRYDESWDETATAFRDALSREKWEQALVSVRRPLGNCLSRKLKDRKLVDSLPGAPKGPYVVIQFDTVFEGKDAAVETVTPARGSDGRWLVAGYFIR